MLVPGPGEKEELCPAPWEELGNREEVHVRMCARYYDRGGYIVAVPGSYIADVNNPLGVPGLRLPQNQNLQEVPSHCRPPCLACLRDLL